MLSPLTTPYYLTTNQSENCAQADRTSCNSSPSSFLLKCFPYNLSVSLKFLHISWSQLLSGTYSTSVLSLPQPGVSRLVYCAQVSKLKFHSVTTTLFQ